MSRGLRSPDPVTCEVIWQRLIAVCDEMAALLVSACYSPTLRDVGDYTTAVVDSEARTLAINTGGSPTHFKETGERIRHGIDTYQREGFAAGDLIMVNHTAITGQHCNNVQVYAPVVLDDGYVAGFAAADAHWQDIGGITANRPTGGTIDCYQEGIQVPSVKVYRAGVAMDDIIRLIAGNLRRPDISLGDFRAQVAACRAGAERLRALFSEFGLEMTAAAIDTIWRRSERFAREAVSRIPDGVYRASSFLDDDAYDPEVVVPIDVEVRVNGTDVVVDLSHLSDQARGGINSRSLAPINMAFKSLTSPRQPLSAGDFAPLTVICPEGKLITARPGAPMGSWSWPFATILDTILLALHPALPGSIAAGNAGVAYGAAFFFGTHHATGAAFSNLSLLPVGWGGRPNRDGTTAHGMMFVNIRDTPVEVTEALNPFVVERYTLVMDGGGPGRFRGGLGIEYVVRCLEDTFASFELDRTKCLPWGLDGGGSGTPGYHELQLPDGTVVVPPRRAMNVLAPAGSRIVIRTGGGGGYGDPRMRSPERVLSDVIDGYVSIDNALTDYGVAIIEEDGEYRLA